MCLVLESEVILANVLSKTREECGVNKDDLLMYCNDVKSELAKIEEISNEYLYFELDNQSIKDTVNKYDLLFVQMGKEIYGYEEINTDIFNSRYEIRVSEVLNRVAIEFAQKLCQKKLVNR